MKHYKIQVSCTKCPIKQGVWLFQGVSIEGGVYRKFRTRPYKTNFRIMSEYDVADFERV